MSTPFTSSSVAVVRRNRSLGMALLPLVTLVAAASLGAGEAVLFAVPVLLGVGVLVLLWARDTRRVETEVELRADRAGVHVNGELFLHRTAIKEGFVIPMLDGRPIVRLTRKGLRGAVDLRVPTETHGRELLRALGLDVSQTVAQFLLPSSITADPRRAAGSFYGVLGIIGLWLCLILFASAFKSLAPYGILCLPLAAMAYTLLLHGSRTRLEIGADGLLVRRGGRERFYPYDAIDDVREYEDWVRGKNGWAGVKVSLGAGEVLTFPVAARGGIAEPRVRLVAERIREALRDHRRGAHVMDTALLRRGERPHAEWVRALRSVGAGAAADHRNAPVPPDKLLSIAEDPRAEPLARAGAAVALSGALDDDGRARLRAAAEATVMPRVRVALEAAAREAREEELIEALSALEASEAEEAASAR